MSKPSVTVVRCRVCNRVEGITSEKDRFWCAWCQNWVAVDAVAVAGTVLVADGDQFRIALAPIPPARGSEQVPLRIPSGWRIEYSSFWSVDLDPTRAWESGGGDLFFATNEQTRRAVDAETRVFNGNSYRVRILPLVAVDPPAQRNRAQPLEVDWQTPLFTFETTSPTEFVAELEACLRGERG